MSKLEELRAKLRQEQEDKNNKKKSNGAGVRFPFWNTEQGESTKLRFLPDADSSNIYFWREEQIIKLPFSGVKGEHNNECYVTVPCMATYGKPDPITNDIRPLWDDESTKDIARTYYRQQSFIFQGFVVKTDIEEENKPENPIRIFRFKKQLADIVKSSMMSDDMDNLPTDYDNGSDFIINVTKNGAFKAYSTSTWARKERALNDDELEAIEKYGLNDLGSFLPPEPNKDQLNAIMEMYEASRNHEMYDPERWGEFYRPYGIQSKSSTSENNEDENFTNNISDQSESESISESSSKKALEKLINKRKGNA